MVHVAWPCGMRLQTREDATVCHGPLCGEGAGLLVLYLINVLGAANEHVAHRVGSTLFVWLWHMRIVTSSSTPRQLTSCAKSQCKLEFQVCENGEVGFGS